MVFFFSKNKDVVMEIIIYELEKKKRENELRYFLDNKSDS